MKRMICLAIVMLVLLSACGETDALHKMDTNALETLAVFPMTIHNSDFAGTCGGHILADTIYEYFRGNLDTAMSGMEPAWEQINPKPEEGSE